MIWRQTAATRVNLLGPKFNEPPDQVFENALLKLMEDIWHDGKKYIREGKMFPEWTVCGLKVGFTTRCVKCRWIVVT
jgi:hypothetical protein